MKPRQYMIAFREKNQIDLERMARVCDCSEILLENAELDDKFVTHPNIAKRIKKAYKLTNKQYEGLLSENRRPSSPNYDPDRYVVHGDFITQLKEEKK